ncbi:hypothetical protein EHQ58_03210 [Leptospira ognonensis]|uniref:Uncharacterized protein n=1 Tax=Leptospira ognonensis TaxID=2484945 RepID=A0A4R9K7E2_9LEPT|nr:hypothetical protein [Leptospira ognonensis]TGL62228.1 hypothetical protein EHQ58_03210 [Leptospira ognonensis]
MKFKIFSITFVIFFLSVGLLAETPVQNLKSKNQSNQKERGEMLDLLRAKLKNEFKLEVQFVVNHFKVSGDYAWFKGDVKRLDGKKIELSEEEGYDCCHVESLFQKQAGKWTIVEANAFSSDVWWEGIGKRYNNANPAVFKE